MPGRLVHSRDFERLRAAGAWSRSAHFAAHHLPGPPTRPRPASKQPPDEKLSTGPVDEFPGPVDKSADRLWLGTVLPKRLARRSVTRNLLRRQICEAVRRHADTLPPGLWVVRLRAAFARAEFASAASLPLRQAARAELDSLFARRAGRP